MNNRLKSGYCRDSFDRFGDDLCDYLLQYLSFKDKIRYECVSKQWKRCVFNKQYELNFELSKTYEFDKNFVTILFEFYGDSNQSVIIETIETLLKKCAFIKNIIISEDIKLNKLLTTIANNCEQLTSIQLNCDHFSEQELTYFGRKCGENLTKVCLSDKCESDMKYRSLLKLCPNLMRAENVDVSYLIDNSDNSEQLLLPKLCELKGVYGYEKTNLIDTFNAAYKYRIKSFHAILDDRLDAQNLILNQISCFANLVNLEILFEVNGELTQQFDEKLSKIGEKNCSRIKLLRLISIEHSGVLRLINSFSQLSHFELYMSCFDASIDSESALSVMKGCVQLKHMIIVASISDAFFSNIHQYLPRISFLKVHTTKSLTDKFLDSVSKLSELKTVIVSRLCSDISAVRASKYSIEEDVTSFTAKAICGLVANCNELNSFSLYTRNSLTIETYEKLIETAINRRRIVFTHQFFNGLTDDHINECLNRHNNLIPGKLKICLLKRENILSD